MLVGRAGTVGGQGNRNPERLLRDRGKVAPDVVVDRAGAEQAVGQRLLVPQGSGAFRT